MVEWSFCKTTIILKVENIEKARNILVENGVELEGEIIETPVHSYRKLRDFDGNRIEIAQFKEVFLEFREVL